MARTNISTQSPLGPYPAGGSVSAAALDLAWTAADATNHNKFKFSGSDVVLVWNTDSGSHNLALTSAPDEHGRSADIASYAVGAGKISLFDFRNGAAGWKQSDGNVYLQADDATVKFAVLSIP
jgi:hypothetical protein